MNYNTNKDDNLYWEETVPETFYTEEDPMANPEETNTQLYALHTDYRIGVRSFDCFYGWGEPRHGEACIQHTVLSGLDLDNAAWISRLLEDLNYQVVVTHDNDWSEVVIKANVAIRYDADHVH